MTDQLTIFDLDGTLSDSHTAIVRCFAGSCEAHGQAAPPHAAIAAMIGLPLTVMYDALAPDGPRDALIATYKSTYIAFDKVHTSLFAGIADMLAALKGPLAVATSKGQTGAARTLRMLEIDHHFDIVLGFDSVVHPKPAPDMVQEAMRLAGKVASETVMVGDTTFDLEMADAAGVRCIGVTWGAHSREKLASWRLVESVSELQRALG